MDRRQKGTITMDSLEEILSTALQKDRLENEDLFMEIRDAVNPVSDADTVTEKLGVLN